MPLRAHIGRWRGAVRRAWGKAGPRRPAIVDLQQRALACSSNAIALLRVTDELHLTYISANPAYERMSGYSLAELQALKPTELVALKTSAGYRDLLHAALTKGRAEGRVQTLRRDGTTFMRSVSLCATRDPNDEAYYVASVSYDLTESEKIAEALRLQARAIEASQNGLMITRAGGPDNPIVMVNRSFERITGYDAAEVIGRDARFLHGGAAEQPELRAIRNAVREGRSISVVLENFRKDGKSFWNELHIDPVRDESGAITHFIGVINDVTTQRESAARIHQMQKLKAIGDLTGGIAHDFNNLLTVVIGNLRLMENATEDPVQRRRVALAISAAQRGADLPQRLSAYSRTQRLREEPVPINELVRSIEPLLSRTLGEHISVRSVLEPDLWQTVVDRSQLENAILNLAINARDAMPDGGDLTITTENIHLNGVRTEPDLPSGDYIRLTVSDTGIGMTRDVKERAFEPFFTTKEVGKGTGLGLSSAYGFVKQSGGHMALYSELGFGTAVKVYLPRAVNGQAQPTEPSRESMDDVERGHGEVILVVEDDDQVRNTTSAIIRQFGYRVVEATTADEALHIVADRSDLALVLSDVVMPGQMTGYDLYKSLQRLRPDLPVLLTSGYPREAIPRRVVNDPNLTLIPKPFDVSDLVRALRTQLAATAPIWTESAALI